MVPVLGRPQPRTQPEHDWAEQVAQAEPLLRFVPVLSEADAGWTGPHRFVHQAVMADLPDLSGHQVYACGAPLMVEAAQRDAVAQCRATRG